MARQRQRARDRKQRAREQAANPGPRPTEPHRANVPGALDHASGEVEEFEAAIVAGAEGDAADDGLGADVSEAEIERQALEAAPEPRRRRRAAARARSRRASAGGVTTGGGNRFINFLRASWAELQRVQWPDRRQVAQATPSSRLRDHRRRLPRPRRLGRAEGRRLHPLTELMYRWYVVNTYSGHENKVKQNLEHRASSLDQKRAVRQVVVPTETVSEMKDDQKVAARSARCPATCSSTWSSTRTRGSSSRARPGVTGFVGASNEPVPLTQPEVDRLLHREVAQKVATKAQFSIGESVKVVSGPLSDFSGEISEINQDAAKLKVLVSIFGRETPVEVGFDQVKKI